MSTFPNKWIEAVIAKAFCETCRTPLESRTAIEVLQELVYMNALKEPEESKEFWMCGTCSKTSPFNPTEYPPQANVACTGMSEHKWIHFKEVKDD